MTGANDRFKAGFHRMAALHGELARVCEDLARDAGITLADLQDMGVTPTVPVNPPTTPTHRTSNGKALLSTKELAALLQCHPRTLRRMELAGELPAPVRKGRLKRWRRNDLGPLLDAGPHSKRRRAT